MTKTIGLLYFDAGGGHRSAANALCEVARQQNRPWNMRMINLQELLDSLDLFRKLTGLRAQDIYNLMLRRGWTLGSQQILQGLHGLIRVYHRPQVRLLKRYWKEHPADLVLSVVPNFNRAIFESVRGLQPEVPMVTILTDLADYPPHFWIEPDQEQYFICGSDRAYQQARAMGHPAERVFRTSGMILSPHFYKVALRDRLEERALLGLDPETATVMLMFGGEGSVRMIEIIDALSKSDLTVQVIAIAGNNPKLEARLRAMPSRVRVHVEGFTREVPRFMGISDVFIGKPGPGSISEAIAMGLPVIIEKNIWTLPQERYNAQWVQDMGLGIPVRDFRSDVVDAVAKVLDPVRRKEILARVTAQRNQAVFEIPEILDRIMDQAR